MDQRYTTEKSYYREKMIPTILKSTFLCQFPLIKLKITKLDKAKPLTHFAKCVWISSCLNYLMLSLIYSVYTGLIFGCLLSIVIKLIIISYYEKAMKGVMILICTFCHKLTFIKSRKISGICGAK